MKPKHNYILILLLSIPLLGVGQNSPDTSKINSQDILTSKGGDPEIDLPIENMALTSQVVAKSQTINSPEAKVIPALTIQKSISQKESTPIDELKIVLENDLEKITKSLSMIGLEYRQQRILKIRKEETEYDLSFLNRLNGIKETIAYETTGNSENFIIAAEQFLDTLYNENTNVSEQFKDLSQERYDTYLAKNKIIKLRINDVKVERNKNEKSDGKKYKYSGFAIIKSFGKKVRVEFFSDSFVRRADERLMYEVAKEDNIEQVITIEGIVDEFKHGRIKPSNETNAEIPSSIILIKEWIIMDRELLIKEFEK